METHKKLYHDRMNDALAQLAAESQPDFSAAAREHDLEPTTLSKRFHGKTTSRAEACSEKRQLLTIAQEEALIDQSNKLTVRGLPLSSQIVKNLATDICQMGLD
jgi:hypothetical protein